MATETQNAHVHPVFAGILNGFAAHIAPDTFNDEFRLYPDGWTGMEHRQGKCGGSAYCEYCAAQEEADRDAIEVRCTHCGELDCTKCDAMEAEGAREAEDTDVR